MAKFDPYHKWLAIPPKEQPPHLYRLLGIPLYEGDADVIENAVDRQMIVLRTFANGEHSDLSQKILNQVSAAKVLLLNAEKKANYDARLRKKLAPQPPVAKTPPTPNAETSTPPAAVPSPATAEFDFAPSGPTSVVARRKKSAWQSPATIIVVALGLVALVGVVVVATSGDGSQEVAAKSKSESQPPRVVVEPGSKGDPKTGPKVSPKTTDVVKTTPTPAKTTPEPPPEVNPPAPTTPEPDLPEVETTTPEVGPTPQPEDPPEASRLAVPDAEARKPVLEQIQGLFKDEFAAAKSLEQKAELAQMILRQAIQSNNAPVDRYVLLDQTRQLAAEGGDIQTALAAAERIAEEYDVEPLGLQANTATALAEVVRTAEQRNSLATRSLKLVDEAIVVDKYDLADQMVDLALSISRKGSDRDVELIKEIVALQKSVKQIKDAHGQLADEFAALAESPADPEANLACGRFYCFLKGDWERGLPLLAKGSDAKLKMLAEQDLATSYDLAEQVSVGHGWWELAESLDDRSQEQVQARARYHYERAMPGLSGLTKQTVATRLAAAEEEAPTRETRPKPKTDEPFVVATWLHFNRNNMRLYSNGHINSPTGNATWTLIGRELILRWPNKVAPGGAWIDRCTVSQDGRSYRGRNQQGRSIYGTWVSGVQKPN